MKRDKEGSNYHRLFHRLFLQNDIDLAAAIGKYTAMTLNFLNSVDASKLLIWYPQVPHVMPHVMPHVIAEGCCGYGATLFPPHAKPPVVDESSCG